MAHELQRRAERGLIPSARLSHNRRQVDPVDRRALDLLRRGRPVQSQTVRSGAGWEHELASPEATRQAMADAVVTDVVTLGARATVALVVSHAQAEDLADRIRADLAARGHLGGPGLAGPGWTTERLYQAGDRVLLHARAGDRGSGLVNGTTASVVRAGPQGLEVDVDGAGRVVLGAGFVTGTRADGSPNLSHAWARTTDGAQGGTWETAHLLGSAALDSYRGYTGQSRSRRPTHTWNTATVEVTDHGGHLPHRPTPTQEVAAALARRPDAALAAADDPWVGDRRLAQIMAAHRAVLDTGPPDPSARLAAATAQVERCAAQIQSHQRDAAGLQRDLRARGPRFDRRCRWERKQLRQSLGRVNAHIEAARSALDQAQAGLDRLGADRDAYDAFQATQGWRRPALAGARQDREDHWTDTALACVEAGDPLAYGPEPLATAHRGLTRRMAMLEATIPPDREPERAVAWRRRDAAVTTRDQAAGDVADAEEALERARQCHWGRWGRPAITGAEQALTRARDRHHEAVEEVTAAGDRCSELDAASKARRLIVVQQRPELDRLAGQLRRLETAMYVADIPVPQTPSRPVVPTNDPFADLMLLRSLAPPRPAPEMGLGIEL